MAEIIQKIKNLFFNEKKTAVELTVLPVDTNESTMEAHYVSKKQIVSQYTPRRHTHGVPTFNKLN